MHLHPSLRLLPLAGLLLAGSLLLSPACADTGTSATSKKAGKKKKKAERDGSSAAATHTARQKELSPLHETMFHKLFFMLPMEALIILNSDMPEKEQVAYIRKEVLPRARQVGISYRQAERHQEASDEGEILHMSIVKPYENQEELMEEIMKLLQKHNVDPSVMRDGEKKLTPRQQKLLDIVKLTCMDILPKQLTRLEFTPDSASAEMRNIHRDMVATLTSEQSAEEKAASIDSLIVRCARLGLALKYDNSLYQGTQELLVEDKELLRHLGELTRLRAEKPELISTEKNLKVAMDHMDNIGMAIPVLSKILQPVYLGKTTSQASESR